MLNLGEKISGCGFELGATAVTSEVAAGSRYWNFSIVV